MAIPTIMPVYADLGTSYAYDDPRSPEYPPDGIWMHTRWTRRRDGRKMSNWYRDPKLANYFVSEDLRARPRKFEWDPEPCIAFGGKKYPIEPMPRKVIWRAAGNKNYYDLGRGGCIPLPRKTAQWEGPDNLGPSAADLKAAKVVTIEKAGQDGPSPSGYAEGSRAASTSGPPLNEVRPQPNFGNMSSAERRAWKEREKRRKQREKDRARENAELARVERKNAKAWAGIHKAQEREAIRKQQKDDKAKAKEASRQAKAAKEQVARDIKHAKKQLKRLEKDQKKLKLADIGGSEQAKGASRGDQVPDSPHQEGGNT